MNVQALTGALRGATWEKSQKSELFNALEACKSAFVGVALVSGMVNLLTLTGSFFMLQVYDRVIPSRSVPTLVGLALFVGVLYAFQGALDAIRARVLCRIGGALDERLGRRIFDIVLRRPLEVSQDGDGLQPCRDLDQIRSYLSSIGPAAFLDLPWMPLYLLICFLFHPVLGAMATCGALALISLTFLTEMKTREPMRMAAEDASRQSLLAAAGERNAEVLRAMGTSAFLTDRWQKAHIGYLRSQRQANDIACSFGALSKALRMALQSTMLGIGAWLVIEEQASSGVMIASSIMLSRALAPVELAIAHWKGFVAARNGWRRLGRWLEALPERPHPMALPAPRNSVAVEHIYVAPPGSKTIVVQDVAFTLNAGDALGIIGPSASGKSSLARALVGVWAPVRGEVRLDGAAMDQWDPVRLGCSLGYLPQGVELFSGSIADNIARLDPDKTAQKVIAAAQAAGVHELILHLPEGYETRIGEGGVALSAGQRQRVALARALYGDPFFVVLDEPNSNLDAEGDSALSRAIASVRARNGIVVVIAHRPSALTAVDQVLVMANGKQKKFGPKAEVLAAVTQKPEARYGASAASMMTGILKKMETGS